MTNKKTLVDEIDDDLWVGKGAENWNINAGAPSETGAIEFDISDLYDDTELMSNPGDKDYEC